MHTPTASPGHRALARSRSRSTLLALWLCSAAAGTVAAAEPPMQFLFAGQARPAREAGQTGPTAWKLGEYTALRLVTAENGAEPSQHPVAMLSPERLRQLLAEIRLAGSGTETLFGRDELDSLIPAIIQALQSARPDQDLLLLSTSRRQQGLFGNPLSMALRLFVRNDELNLLAGADRLDLVARHRSTGLIPEIAFGSRLLPGSPQLTGSGSNRRPDWLVLPLQPPTAQPGAASGHPAAGTTGSIEQRLRALKHLREQDLITDEDYTTRRRELLREL